MKYIISYSGGLGSAASVLLAHELGLDYEAWFADTQIEDEDLYRFNTDLEQTIGRRIRRLADGRDPWEVFEDVRYIGNTRTAHCSQILKTDQIRQLIGRLYGEAPADLTLILGMGLSEEDRLERARVNWHPIPVESLLINHHISPSGVRELIEKYQLRIPRLYDAGFPHNNCGGFCVRAGLKQFATLLETNPARFALHERRMNATMEKIGPTAVPFLRQVNGGEITYLTLTDFRKGYENGSIEVDPFDYGGCDCFVVEVEGWSPKTARQEARTRRLEIASRTTLDDLLEDPTP